MPRNAKRKSRGSSTTARNANKHSRRAGGDNGSQSELLSHSTAQLTRNRTTRSTTQQQTSSRTTRSTPRAADAAINQTEDDGLITTNDIPTIVDAVIRSLPLSSSLPSNQPASQQQSPQLIQRETQPLPEQQQQQQPNQQQQTSLIPGQPL